MSTVVRYLTVGPLGCRVRWSSSPFVTLSTQNLDMGLNKREKFICHTFKQLFAWATSNLDPKRRKQLTSLYRSVITTVFRIELLAADLSVVPLFLGENISKYSKVCNTFRNVYIRSEHYIDSIIQLYDSTIYVAEQANYVLCYNLPIK